MFTLLIVDDELRTREGLASLIEKSGLPLTIVGKASNGIEGLTSASRYHPDIIITDVRMPRMNGIELVTEIRKFDSDCQIIFLSGYSDKEYLKSAITLKAVDYVEKPILREELIQALQSAIQAAKQKAEERKLYANQKNSLTEKAALDLTTFHITNVQLDTLSTLEPEFSASPCFFTLICQVKYRECQENSNFMEVSNQIHGVLSQFSRIMVKKEDHLFLIHLGTSSADSEAVFLFASQLQNSLSGIADSFIAIGSAASSLSELASSYFDAIVCLKKLFFLGYNRICSYQSSDAVMQLHYQFDESLLDTFDTALKNADFATVSKICSSLFTDMHKTCYKFECNHLRNTYYQFLTHLSRIAQERQISNLFLNDMNYIWETIAVKDTIFELQDYLTQKLFLYQEEVTNGNASSSPVHRIYQYIENHYSDKNLTVNRLADDLHFTPAYLCQIFKAQSGTTINSYLNSFRINKSKELLKEREGKLYEISLRVGYRNPDHFTKQFKKYVGITPSEYREKYLL